MLCSYIHALRDFDDTDHDPVPNRTVDDVIVIVHSESTTASISNNANANVN